MVTYQSIVKGATKIKLAPPKEKYLTPILIGCSSSSSKDTQDILYLLHKRLKDTAFTICYKSLIVLHYIINECNNSNNELLLTDVYNEFLRNNTSGPNDYYCRASESDLLALKRYKEYLFARIELSFNENNKKDLVDPAFLKKLKKNNSANIDSTKNTEKIPVEKIITTVKLQVELISKLLKNKYSIHDLSNTNDLLLTCFKLLTNDLLVLYNILNEGIITVLESFFELKIDVQREACELYDEFVNVTEDVVKYLKIGKQCGLKIPVIKHITTKLGKSLREHIESPENANNSEGGSGKELSAKDQLEKTRKQRQMLETQLRTTSTNLMTPLGTQATQFSSFPAQQAVNPIQTGNNPFLSGAVQQPQQTNNVFAQQQQPQQTNNVFAQQQVPQQTNNVFAQPQQAQQTNNVFMQPQPQPTNNVFLQQQVPQQQTGFQQVPQQQTGFQQVPQQQTGFQQVPQQQTGFQQVPQQQTGFQQVPQQQTGFQQAPQQQTGFQQANNVFLQQPQQTGISTNLVQQQTTNPFFAAAPSASTENKPVQSKSLNPFTMDNVQKENLKRQETNPFSMSNQPEVENKLVNKNPFAFEKEGAVFGNVQHPTGYQTLQPTGFQQPLQQSGYQQQAGFQQPLQQTGYQQQAGFQQQQQTGYHNNPQGFSLIDL